MTFSGFLENLKYAIIHSTNCSNLNKGKNVITLKHRKKNVIVTYIT